MTIRHDDRIRQRAFAIWESAGRPVGRDLEHWLAAERELRAEGAQFLGNRDSVAPAASPSAPKTVSPAPQADKASRKRTAEATPAKAGKSSSSRKKKDAF